MGKTADRIHAEQLPGNEDIKWIVYTDTPYYMKPGDHVLYANSAAGAINIYLPPMHLAAGKFYFIQAPVGATADVKVYDRESKTMITTYGDMDANDDHAVFFCTGRAWLTVFDGVA